METAHQFQMLTDMGCNLIQGYIYSCSLEDIDVEPIIDRQTGHTRTASGQKSLAAVYRSRLNCAVPGFRSVAVTVQAYLRQQPHFAMSLHGERCRVFHH
ncbi:hypothetical protein [uncultured Agrobacterium sp.]|uniref:hypothetical protein n=1 Tax=uncultured Agrobacterium sp. TaxID=157277 RepID=UPI00342A1717